MQQYIRIRFFNFVILPILTALLLIYFYDISAGAYPGAVLRSQDMQWFGAFEFWAGFDPYFEFLINKISYKTQFPNYGHLLYIVMYPFAILDPTSAAIAWAFLNFSCFLLSFSIYYFDKNIPKGYTLLASWLLLHGYCYSNVVNNGQFALVALALITCAWKWRVNVWVLTGCLALLFTKYSFGLPIMLGFFLAGYCRSVLYAIAINLIAALIFSFKFGTPLFQSILMPITVAIGHGNYAAGPSDLLSLGRILGSNVGESNVTLAIFIAAYLFFIYVCLKYRNFLSDVTIISCAIILSLCTFIHLGYDHVVLYAPLLMMRSVTYASDVKDFLMLVLCYLLWHMASVYTILGIVPPGTVSMKLSVVHAIIFISIMMLICYHLIISEIKYRKSMPIGEKA